MSEHDKKLEELSVQEHLDQIQGRKESRPKVALEDATTEQHLQAIRGEIELVPRSELPEQDEQQEQDEDDNVETEPDNTARSVEFYLEQIQNRKRR